MGLGCEEFVGGPQHIFRLDGQQPGFRRSMAGVVAAALGAAQDFEPGPEWTVAAGVGGPIDAHNRPDEGASQVQRAGIPRDHEGNTAAESDQLFQ
jgi:hypothetical protein